MRMLMDCGLTLWMAVAAANATPQQLAEQIKAVGPEGQGNAAAMAAMKELSQLGPDQLPGLLKEFDGASPLASNWLLGAWEEIAARALKAGKLPKAELEAFVVDRANHAGARRIAYEWLLKVDPSAEERLIPTMLLDPTAEFRRDAVARELAAASKLEEGGDKEAAKSAYQKALVGAVDEDQVKAIVKPLKEMGVEVDLQQHFGFVPNWKLIGPFDNTDKKGFNVAYPPERELNFAATYSGKDGEVTWKPFSTEDDYGKVDLTKALAPHKGAITYAAAEFTSERPQTVDVRLTTPNAWKLWVNGELLFAREEYHRGSQFDQYRVPVKLKQGPNVLLLKVCQNEQTEEWAQDWVYQLRVCDAAGAAVLPATSKTSQRSPSGDVQIGRN